MFEKITNRIELKNNIHAFYISFSLHAFVRLGLPERLKIGPSNVETLASQLKLEPDSLMRYMRIMESVGIVFKCEIGNYHLAEVGNFLLMDHPDSIARETLMFAGEEVPLAWHRLLYSLQTGKPAFSHVFGAPLFEYLAKEPSINQRFHDSWYEITAQVTKEALRVLDFSASNKVMDVGGGHGQLLSKILANNKHLHGILFDLPKSLMGATEVLKNDGVLNRVEVFEGNALEMVPSGADTILLKSTLHCCSDKDSITILANCANSLPTNGRVFVMERVIPDNDCSHWSIPVDVTMLVITGGRERTLDDYRQLYRLSGFTFVRELPLPSGFSVLEGIRN